MSTLKAFSIWDLLDYNRVNLDILTETVIKMINNTIYTYIFCSLIHFSMENIYQNGKNIVWHYGLALIIYKDIVIYIIYIYLHLNDIVLGKVEGDKNNEEKKNWHGHVTVILFF